MQAYMAPSWFFGYDIILEFLFATITLLVALLAFKVHKATVKKQSFYLAWAFLLISISYFLQSILNLLMVTKLNENICGMIRLQSVALFNTIGLYIHIVFMIIGLSLLSFMSLKSKDIKILLIIILSALSIIFLSVNTLLVFYACASILLSVIAWYFVKNFLRHKNSRTLMVAVAFLFLLFGRIHFLFAVDHQLFYAIGHFLELIAYSLVLLNFFMVLKR